MTMLHGKMKRCLTACLLVLFAGACQQPLAGDLLAAPSPTRTETASPSPLPSRSPTPQPTWTVTPTITLTPTSSPTAELPFDFVLTGDVSNHTGPGAFDTEQFFRGVCENIKRVNPGAFMVTVGDVGPVQGTRWTIDQVLGTDTIWFPVVGNHELLLPDEMAWLRAYQPDTNGDLPPNLVNRGPAGCPETTYSFDQGNAHFVILNVYCRADGDTITDGAMVDDLYYWLEADLAATQKELLFVFGHEPAFPQPDAENGIIRHLGDSLDKYPVTRDRFWALLKNHGRAVYINGHTHSYSVVKIDEVWQVDVGHSQGAWVQATPSTFIVVHVIGGEVLYETYRTEMDGSYTLHDAGQLD
jgi:hypothetical protein